MANFSLSPYQPQLAGGNLLGGNLGSTLASFGSAAQAPQMLNYDLMAGQNMAGGILGNAGQGLNINAPSGTGFQMPGLTGQNAAGGGLGFNMGTMQLGLQGIGSLGNLWMANKSLGLAKDQFNLTKSVTNTNLNNSIKSYNSSLEDRLKTRAQFNGDAADSWQDDYEKRKAVRE